MHKRDFGSFHVSNVEELVALTEYTPPSVPVVQPTFEHYRNGEITFGKTMRHSHFYLEEDCVFLNHGAFGCVLKEALQVAQAWQVYAERQPLRFIDRELLPHIVHVTHLLAQFVGADARDILLIQNVTTGLNCIFKSIDLKPNDVIYTLSIVYGATKKIIKEVCSKTGARIEEVPVTFPVRDSSQITELVRRTLGRDVKLAVFDHIPSNTPLIMPVQEIIQICQEREVQVVIDGAHALGSQPLDMSSLKPDYYVANCHKWLCAPKGVAFMYVRRELQADIHPVITSHGYGAGMHSEFSWQGLRDYSGWLALPTVLQFWNTVISINWLEMQHHFLKKPGRLNYQPRQKCLSSDYDTGSMVLVKLPAALWHKCSKVTYTEAETLQNILYFYNIEVPVKVINDELYVRISAHIHNSLGDYQKLADAVLDITDKKTLQ